MGGKLFEQKDLTQGPVMKGMLQFFVPIALGAIVQQLYNTVDALIVGKFVGTAALAAISGSVSQILNLMVGIFIALTGGSAVVISQLYGINDKKRIKTASYTAMFTCSIIGVIISVIGVFCSRTLLIWLKTPEDTLDDATIYLQWCFAAAIAVILYNMGSSIIRAAGDSTKPFIYLCACSFTNVVLDYVFVKVFSWGVWGAAAATAFSQFVSATLVLIQMFKTDEAYKLEIKKENFTKQEIKSMLKFGIPSAVQQLMYGISNTYIQVIINLLGTNTVAAWALTGKVDGIYWSIMNSAGIAIMTFTGQNYGAGNLSRVREGLKKSFIYFMIFTVVLCSALALFAKDIYPWFLDDKEVTDYAYYIMMYFVCAYAFWTVIEIFGGVLKGCGDVIVPAVITTVCIAGLRVLWIYIMFPKYPVVEIPCLAYDISWVIAAIALFVRFKQGKWKERHEV